MGKKKDEMIRAERIEELRGIIERKEYIQKYSYGISVVEALVKQYNRDYRRENGRILVDTIISRIKKAESIADKLEQKGYEISYTNAVHRLNDLVGIRIICSFCDDVYRVARHLENSPELTIVKYKDYINKPKASGYQSIHLIMEVDYPLGRPGEKVRIEVQIRTVAMNYWAKLEHQLCYKTEKKKKPETDKIRQEIRQELRVYAEEIAEIDKKMLAMRKRIESI